VTELFTRSRAGGAAAERFRTVVEEYPSTRAVESARSILDRDFGGGGDDVK
jgi:outer membrane protein assembly factor BamD (BamD/ComL family)